MENFNVFKNCVTIYVQEAHKRANKTRNKKERTHTHIFVYQMIFQPL